MTNPVACPLSDFVEQQNHHYGTVVTSSSSLLLLLLLVLMCLAQMFGIFARYTKELKFILAEYIYEIFVEMTKKNTLKNSSMLYYIKKFFNYGLLSVKKKCLQKVRFSEQLIMLVIKIFFSRINAYKSTKSRAILRTLVGSGVQSWSVLFCHLFFVINKH